MGCVEETAVAQPPKERACAELTEHATSMTAANDFAVRRALEGAGVEFIDENGGGPGLRLRKRQRAKKPK
jgi:hypothetical protein